MARNQVSVTIPRSFKAWVDAYCGEAGVHASELLRLLIIREKRLQTLAAVGPAAEAATLGMEDRATLTAYFVTEQEVEEFDAYARMLGLTRRRAAYLLIDAERSDRWLERMLSSA